MINIIIIASFACIDVPAYFCRPVAWVEVK